MQREVKGMSGLFAGLETLGLCPSASAAPSRLGKPWEGTQAQARGEQAASIFLKAEQDPPVHSKSPHPAVTRSI